jgi:hypothetical protein
MQYGGRPFTPWAPYEGGPDLTYCLGLENAVGAFANGLEFARNQKTLLGNPTTVTIPALGQKTSRYGVLMAPYKDSVLDEGVSGFEAEEKRLVFKAKDSAVFDADPKFTVLKSLESHHV